MATQPAWRQPEIVVSQANRNTSDDIRFSEVTNWLRICRFVIIRPRRVVTEEQPQQPNHESCGVVNILASGSVTGPIRASRHTPKTSGSAAEGRSPDLRSSPEYFRTSSCDTGIPANYP